MSVTDKSLLPLHEIVINEELDKRYAKLTNLERAYKKGTKTHSDPDRWAIEQFNQDPWCFFTELVKNNQDYSRLDDIYNHVFARAIEGGNYRDNTHLYRYFTEIVITPQLNVLYRGLPEGNEIESDYYLDDQGNYIQNPRKLGIGGVADMPNAPIYELHQRRVRLGLSPLIKVHEKEKLKYISIELPKLTNLNLLFNSFPIRSSRDGKDQRYFLLMKNNRNEFFTKAVITSYSVGYGRLNPKEGMLDCPRFVPFDVLEPTTESNNYLFRFGDGDPLSNNGMSSDENQAHYTFPIAFTSMNNRGRSAKFYDLEYCNRESVLRFQKIEKDEQGRDRLKYTGEQKRPFVVENPTDNQVSYLVPPSKIDCPFYYADYALFMGQLETYRAENKLQWWQFYFDVGFDEPIEVPHKTKSYLNATFIPVRYSWDNEHVKAATNGKYKSIYDHWAYDRDWLQKEANHPRYKEEAIVYAEMVIKEGGQINYANVPLYRSAQDGLVFDENQQSYSGLTRTNPQWIYPSDVPNIAKSDIRYTHNFDNIAIKTLNARFRQWCWIKEVEYFTFPYIADRDVCRITEIEDYIGVDFQIYHGITKNISRGDLTSFDIFPDKIRTYTVKARLLSYLNLDEHSLSDNGLSRPIDRFFPNHQKMKEQIIEALPEIDTSVFSDHKWGVQSNSALYTILGSTWFEQIPAKYHEFVLNHLYLGNGYYRVVAGESIENKWGDPNYYGWYADWQAFGSAKQNSLTATPVMDLTTNPNWELYDYQPHKITKIIPVSKLPAPTGSYNDRQIGWYLGYSQNNKPIKSAHPFGIISQRFYSINDYQWMNENHQYEPVRNIGQYINESINPNAFKYGGPCFEWNNLFIPLVPLRIYTDGGGWQSLLIPMGAYVKYFKNRTNPYGHDISDLHYHTNGLDVFGDRWWGASYISYRLMSHPLTWMNTISAFINSGDYDPTGMKTTISHHLYHDITIDNVSIRDCFSPRYQYEIGTDVQYRPDKINEQGIDVTSHSLTWLNQNGNYHLLTLLRKVNNETIPEVTKFDIVNNDLIWIYYGFKTGYFDLVRRDDPEGRGKEQYQQYLQILAIRKLKPRTRLTEEEQANWSYWKEPLILEILDKFIACMQDENQRWSNPNIMRYLTRMREIPHLMSALGWYLDEFKVKDNLSNDPEEVGKIYCLVGSGLEIDFGEKNQNLYVGENYLKGILESETVRQFKGTHEDGNALRNPLFRRIGTNRYDLRIEHDKINAVANEQVDYYDFSLGDWAKTKRLGYLHFDEVMTTPLEEGHVSGMFTASSIYTNNHPLSKDRDYFFNYYGDDSKKEEINNQGKITANHVWAMYYRILPVYLPIFRHHKYHIEPYIVSVYFRLIRDEGYFFNDEFVEHIAEQLNTHTTEFYKEYPPTEQGMRKLLTRIKSMLTSQYHTFIETPNKRNRWLGKHHPMEVTRWASWFKPTYELLPLFSKGKVITTARYDDLVKLHDCWATDYERVIDFIEERSDYNFIIVDKIEAPGQPLKVNGHISGIRILHDLFESRFSTAVNTYGFMGYEIPDNIRWDPVRNRGRVRPLLEYINPDMRPSTNRFLLTYETISKNARPSTINHVYALMGNPNMNTLTNLDRFGDIKCDTYGEIELVYQREFYGFSVYDFLFYLVRTGKLKELRSSIVDSRIRNLRIHYTGEGVNVVNRYRRGIVNYYTKQFLERYNSRDDIVLGLKEVNSPNPSAYHLVHHQLMENENKTIIHPFGRLTHITAERDINRLIVKPIGTIDQLSVDYRGYHLPPFVNAYYHGEITFEVSEVHATNTDAWKKVEKMRTTKHGPNPITFIDIMDYSAVDDSLKPFVYRWSPTLKDNKGRIRPSPLSKVRHADHPLKSYTKNVDWFAMMTPLEIFLSNELEELHMTENNVTVPPHLYKMLVMLDQFKLPAFDKDFKFNTDGFYYKDPMIDNGNTVFINPLLFFYQHHSMKMVDYATTKLDVITQGQLTDGTTVKYAFNEDFQFGLTYDRWGLEEDDNKSFATLDQEQRLERTKVVPNYFYGQYDGIPRSGMAENLLDMSWHNMPSSIYRLNQDISFVPCDPVHANYPTKLPKMDTFDIRRTNDSRPMHNNMNPFPWGLDPWYELFSLNRTALGHPANVGPIGEQYNNKSMSIAGIGVVTYLADRNESWYKVKSVGGYYDLHNTTSITPLATIPDA